MLVDCGDFGVEFLELALVIDAVVADGVLVELELRLGLRGRWILRFGTLLAGEVEVQGHGALIFVAFVQGNRYLPGVGVEGLQDVEEAFADELVALLFACV